MRERRIYNLTERQRQGVRQLSDRAERERESDRQTDRQTDRQAGRQAGRQTDRQTDRQRQRQRHKDKDRDRETFTERQRQRENETKREKDKHEWREEGERIQILDRRSARGIICNNSTSDTIFLAVLLRNGLAFDRHLQYTGIDHDEL